MTGRKHLSTSLRDRTVGRVPTINFHLISNALRMGVCLCFIPMLIIIYFPVISTAREPLKGWLDNMYGPTGVAVGSGKQSNINFLLVQ